MTPQQKALYRLMFKERLSRLEGMAFQNFFSEIMQYSDSDFKPVKPQGSQGDWKNDGHNPKAGCYYQVYSPERFDESSAVNKLKHDFTGLVSKWGETSVYPNGVQEFYFVINDRFRVTPGGYPTTIASLEKLKQIHRLKKCELFLSKDLEDILLGLKEDQIISVIGYPPNPADIDVLPLNLVHEVITHIIDSTRIRSFNQSLVNPDFDSKIKFNRLDVTGHLLRDANYRSWSLEEYFNANSKFIRQEVRDRLKGLYDEVKSLDLQGGTDGQLFHILNQITPTLSNTNNRLMKELQDAALVLMAYFFEFCDIFEEPAKC